MQNTAAGSASNRGAALAADETERVPLVELVGLDKQFAGTHALKAVSLSFREAEIHAIVGENGAGKSTLIKLLTGALVRSSGTVRWKGNEVRLDTPREAQELGIDAVHQEVVLCPHLTVAENMFLGRELTSTGLVRRRHMERQAQRTLDDLGFQIRSDVVLDALTIGQQQLVAAARLASRGTRLAIFDEPTSYLTGTETDHLFKLIRHMRSQGTTIVYISHRLEEIFDLADRVSVLRDGRLIATRAVSATNMRQLIVDMVARSFDDLHHKESVPIGETLLEVKGLSGPGFSDISLIVRRGEIVGLYGLIGAGRSEFVQCLFGRHKKTAGTVTLRGKPVNIRREADAIDHGIALLPESRRYQGLCLNLGVGLNLNLAVLPRLSQFGFLRGDRERAAADKQIQDLNITARSKAAQVFTLSGGNQQKIVIGKWLNHGAEIFILDEPTVGVDVATKTQIYAIVAGVLKRGAGVLLISSYLPEVYDLSDTLHVIRKGNRVATHGFREVDHETILAEAIGA